MTRRLALGARSCTTRKRCEREQRAEFWREGFERCGRFGIQGLPIPVEYGGQGQDLPTALAAMEGLGYGCPDTGLIFAINAALWTVTMPILSFGTEAQKRRYLPGLSDGRLLGSNAASEPDAGSDIFSMQTRAEPTWRWMDSERKEDLDHRRAHRRRLPLFRGNGPVKGSPGNHRLSD